jgi:glycosyltransferase involved in cell wall biosynthesis
MNIAVCTVQVPFVKGGAESMAENLLKALACKGHPVEHINLPFKWYPKEQIIRDCITWRLIDVTESYYKKIDLVIPTKFPAYLVRHPRKVIWLAHQFREIYDCFGTPLSGITTAEDDTLIRKAIYEWDLQAFSEARKVFTISRNVSKRLLHYNGIESEHLYVPPKLIGHYLPPSFGDFIFCPGRLEMSKRLDLAIQAVALLPPSIRCIIAGKGPREDNLRELAEELNLGNRVIFTGFLPDEELLKLYSEAFAVFFAPYDEDLGLITLEAFHARKPVLTCPDSGAVLEFVSHENTGFIVEANPESLAAGITWLHQHKQQARDMGESGYQSISGITWDGVVDTLVTAAGETHNSAS